MLDAVLPDLSFIYRRGSEYVNYYADWQNVRLIAVDGILIWERAVSSTTRAEHGWKRPSYRPQRRSTISSWLSMTKALSSAFDRLV